MKHIQVNCSQNGIVLKFFVWNSLKTKIFSYANNQEKGQIGEVRRGGERGEGCDLCMNFNTLEALPICV